MSLLFSKIFNQINPCQCVLCGVEGQFLCQPCQASELTPAQSLCFLCGVATDNFTTCVNCQPKTTLQNVYVAVEFTPLARKLVTHLKYERCRLTARVIAHLMFGVHGDKLCGQTLVPVPTISSHIRQRGFDHMQIIAGLLGADVEVIKRYDQIRRSGATKQQRKSAMKLSKTFTKTADLCIVDDICTTGQSLLQIADNTLAKQALVFTRSP